MNLLASRQRNSTKKKMRRRSEMYDHTSTTMFDESKALALCVSLNKAGHAAVISGKVGKKRNPLIEENDKETTTK